jgi:hypothetical protein
MSVEERQEMGRPGSALDKERMSFEVGVGKDEAVFDLAVY